MTQAGAGTAALVCLLLAGCTPPEPPCAAGTPAITAQLLFGRSIKGGGQVDAAAWQDFLATVITPRFPDGLTILEARGQWRQRGTGRISAEASTVVMIVTAPSPATTANLEAIRDDYRQRFNQDSVGLVVNHACAEF